MKKLNDDIHIFEEYFESCNPKLVSSVFCRKLNFSAQITKKDLVRINDIYERSLMPDTTRIPYEDIGCFDNRGELIERSIAYKFFDKYYIFPNAKKRAYNKIKFDSNQHDINVKSQDILSEIEGDLRNEKLIFLTGNVGEGKSTLIKKMIFENQKSIETDIAYIYLSLIDISIYNIEDTTEMIATITKRINKEKEKEDKKGKKIILVIDELDTFSWHEYQERFIFTETGFNKFNKDVKKIRKIVHEFIRELYIDREVFSIVFSVRTYGLSHFFDIDKQIVPDSIASMNSVIYSIESDSNMAENIIMKRLELFNDILLDAQANKSIKKGTVKVLNEFMHIIKDQFSKVQYEWVNNTKIIKKHSVINKLNEISTQSFRTVIHLYKDLGFNPDLFGRYFTTDILLIYTLGMYEKYSQILPLSDKCLSSRTNGNSNKKYNFPNMFLSISNSEANRISKCRNPSTLSYWLKILILNFIKGYKEITIREILVEFSGYQGIKRGKYDQNLVELTLGSMGTINEYNCIEYEFSNHEVKNYESFVATTKVKLTKRGNKLLEDNLFFDFSIIEILNDDWQLPKPNFSKLMTLVPNGFKKEYATFISKLEEISNNNLTYIHLTKLKGSGKDNDFALVKAKQSIWFLYILEVCLKHEIDYYNVQNIYNYDQAFFEKKRKGVITSILHIYGVGSLYTNRGVKVDRELYDFNHQCKLLLPSLNQFFEEVFQKNILIICDPEGLCSLECDDVY